MECQSSFLKVILLYKADSIRVTHPFAGRHLKQAPMLPLDLHVLSLPLAFILSQDQTLHCISLNIIMNKFQKNLHLYKMWLFYSLITLSISIFSMNLCRVDTHKYFSTRFAPNFVETLDSNQIINLLIIPKFLRLLKRTAKIQLFFTLKQEKNIFFLFLFLKLAIQTFL